MQPWNQPTRPPMPWQYQAPVAIGTLPHRPSFVPAGFQTQDRLHGYPTTDMPNPNFGTGTSPQHNFIEAMPMPMTQISHSTRPPMYVPPRPALLALPEQPNLLPAYQQTRPAVRDRPPTPPEEEPIPRAPDGYPLIPYTEISPTNSVSPLVTEKLWQNSHATYLRNRVEFLPYPSADQVTAYKSIMFYGNNMPTSGVGLFVGQLPNALPLEYAAWVLDTIIGKYAIIHGMIHRGPRGWAKFFVQDMDTASLMLRYTHKIFFDVNGVWVARTPEQAIVMKKYSDHIAAGLIRYDNRIPRFPAPIELLGHPRPPSQLDTLRDLSMAWVLKMKSEGKPLPPGYENRY